MQLDVGRKPVPYPGTGIAKDQKNKGCCNLGPSLPALMLLDSLEAEEGFADQCCWLIQQPGSTDFEEKNI